MKLTVVGAGAFGTAIANTIKKENDIFLFTNNLNILNDVNILRKNTKFFPTKILSKHITATNDKECLSTSDIIFLCIPSSSVVEFIETIKLSPSTIIVNGAKGFGRGSKLIPEALQELIPNTILSLKGPSFANELIFDIPTSFTIASKEKNDFELVKNLFREDLAIFDYSDDLRAVEILSIVKNIYAIIIGIIDASYNSANVRFLIFTKTVKEIRNLLRFLEINTESIFLYAGIGDLGLTSLNDLSRNRTLGLLIGKGFLDKNTDSRVVLEGVKAISTIIKLLPNNSNDSLIMLHMLNSLLNNEIDMKQFLNIILYK